MEREGVEGRLGCEDKLYIGAKGIGVGWEGRPWLLGYTLHGNKRAGTGGG